MGPDESKLTVKLKDKYIDREKRRPIYYIFMTSIILYSI